MGFEISEVGKDMQESTKKTFEGLKKKLKQKPLFFGALAVVLVLALYKLTKGGTDSETTYAYTPSGYDGYPTPSESMLEDMNGGSFWGGADIGGSGGSAWNGESSTNIEDNYLNDSYERKYTEVMEEENQPVIMNLMTQPSIDLTADMYTPEGELLFSKNTAYKVRTDNSIERELQETAEKADNMEYRTDVLNQMQANASAWNSASKSEREILEKENERLAQKVGLSKDDTGVWRNADGTRAWDSPTSVSKGSNVSYDKNIDYSAKIAQAKAEGASASVIAGLEAQKQAKIAGENMTQDANGVYRSSSSKSSGSKSSGNSSSSKSSDSKSSTNSSSSNSSSVKQGTVLGRVTSSTTKNKDGSKTTVIKDGSGKTVAKYTTK